MRRHSESTLEFALVRISIALALVAMWSKQPRLKARY